MVPRKYYGLRFLSLLLLGGAFVFYVTIFRVGSTIDNLEESRTFDPTNGDPAQHSPRSLDRSSKVFVNEPPLNDAEICVCPPPLDPPVCPSLLPQKPCPKPVLPSQQPRPSPEIRVIQATCPSYLPPVLASSQNLAPKQFSFVIKLLTFNRPNSLQRSLESLKAANYHGDVIALDLYLDNFDLKLVPGNAASQIETSMRILNYVDKFVWPHGPKRIHKRQTNAGTQGQWIEAWWPLDDSEYAFFVEDDMELSPHYYTYLKAAIIKYSIDPATRDDSMYGISLQKNKLIPGHFRARQVKVSNGDLPFSYMLLGTWGQLFFPRHWKEFLIWYHNNRPFIARRPYIQGLITTDWYHSRGEKIWTPWFIKYVLLRNWFSLYTNFAGGVALSGSHQEVGVNVKQSTGGIDTKLKTDLTEKDLILPNTEELVRYDYCFERSPRGEIVTTREGLKNLVQSRTEGSGSDIITVIAVNPGYLSMLSNWYCHVRPLRFRSYIFFTIDADFAELLKERGHPVFLYKIGDNYEKGEDPLGDIPALDQSVVEIDDIFHKPDSLDPSLNYGSVAYQQFILLRTRLVYLLLSWGTPVLQADVDAVWTANPLPYLNATEHDLIGQVDVDRFSGGFLFLSNSEAGLQLWGNVSVMHAKLVAEAMKRGKLRGTDESEQSTLFDLLKNPQWKARVKTKGLDPLLFPCGKDYFAKRKPQKANVKPIVIHNNFIIGLDKKITRFKDEGLWVVDDFDYACSRIVCPK